MSATSIQPTSVRIGVQLSIIISGKKSMRGTVKAVFGLAAAITMQLAGAQQSVQQLNFQQLSPVEQQIVAEIHAHAPQALELLGRASSSTAAR
jgi:hypothetical protein